MSSTTSKASKIDGDMILPNLIGLRHSRQLQNQVDQRLQELQAINLQDKFRSQCGGSNEIVWCKREVPWPQDFILSSSSKTRVFYDNLSMLQWVSGFSNIIWDRTEQRQNTEC